VLFLVAVGWVLVSAGSRPAARTLSITFVSIVLEALPFMMLGSLIGGLIEVFISRDRIAAVLPKRRWLAVFLAGLVGMVFPVCECAVIPVARRLLRKGIPFSAAVAYLLAGPIVNPIVAASTAVAYGWDWAIVGARLICGFGIAVFVGLMMDELFPGNRALLAPHQHGTAKKNHAHACGCSGHHHKHTGHAQSESRLERALEKGVQALGHAADDLLNVSRYLIVGAFVAALAQTVIDRQALMALADTPPVSILLMMGMAVGLNLCSESDAFVAASFRMTLPISAQLAFMVLGPMLDLKLIAMYLSFVKKRALAVMAGMMCVLVFALMMLLETTAGAGG